jgi:hypothetical protein
MPSWAFLVTEDGHTAIQARSITHDPNDLSANTDRAKAREVILIEVDR